MSKSPRRRKVTELRSRISPEWTDTRLLWLPTMGRHDSGCDRLTQQVGTTAGPDRRRNLPLLVPRSPTRSAFFAHGRLKRIELGWRVATRHLQPSQTVSVERGALWRLISVQAGGCGWSLCARAVIRRGESRRGGDKSSIHLVRSVTHFLSSFQTADNSFSSSQGRRQTRRVFTLRLAGLSRGPGV